MLFLSYRGRKYYDKQVRSIQKTEKIMILAQDLDVFQRLARHLGCNLMENLNASKIDISWLFLSAANNLPLVWLYSSLIPLGNSEVH